MKYGPIALLAVLLFLPLSPAAVEPPGPETARSWIREMKERHRGPFKRIRWFCKDGTILEPKEDCEDHGGGVQHGEWSDKTKALREGGYYIATVLADIEPKDFVSRPEFPSMLRQMILEQYLIRADDGWIFRKSRYYRGSLQAEDETEKGRALLLTLLNDPHWQIDRFLLLREAVRAIPHGREGAPLTEMRQLSKTIAEKDPAFEDIRIKLHVLPEAGDAAAVRRYARTADKPDLKPDYDRLADLVEAVFVVPDIHKEAASVIGRIESPPITESFQRILGILSTKSSLPRRMAAANRMMATIRDTLPQIRKAETRLALMDLSLALEGFVYGNGAALVADAPERIRREIVVRAWEAAIGIYGMGLISSRQQMALGDSLARVLADPLYLDVYRKELYYLSRISDWADGQLSFYFSRPVEKLREIEPKAANFIHDRLHGNPILFMAETLDLLIRDSDRLAGIEHRLFDSSVGSGLRALNPGMARGPLRLAAEGIAPGQIDPDGIYLLPVTTSDLPRVAGILTAGKGNSLSHVQLLARNLGIPNVAVAERFFPRLEQRAGLPVVLAASPGGVVQLAEDGPAWEGILQGRQDRPELLIRPDLEKLDLSTRAFVTLSEIRAADSGRIAGPKAANLGELKHHFPEAVAEGLVLPFGVFRTMLDKPFDPAGPDGPTIWQWMAERYGQMAELKESPKLLAAFTQEFLDQLHTRIAAIKPDGEFRERLRKAMAEAFGPDGSYGVFIRSDTNVEDLPGFSGAGLNLTVPHVVGVDRIIDAIPRVWASPFTRRAFGWRQAHMGDPMHVYVSVLLMRSVPVDKSGVLVTVDIDTGSPDWLTVAVNEGPGGAVEGQGAEELRVHMATGRVRLLAQATEPRRVVLLPEGGITRVPASGRNRLLTASEIRILMELARSAPQRFPRLRNDSGETIPADMEFGFLDGELALFQIRPFLESGRARADGYLISLDAELAKAADRRVDLDTPPN